jgi:hypothetical protein
VLEALCAGRVFVAHDILADARGATCFAESADGDLIAMGEERPFEPGVVCRLRLPVRADIRWIVDGEVRLQRTGRELAARPMHPGVHRFEARLDGRPWFYANPFYLR